MTLHTLEITTHTPLHVGSGGVPLRQNIDFASFGRFTYVFDLDRVFDYILPDAADTERLDSITRSANLASFLKEQDFRQHPELALYRLGGTAGLSEIRPQIKTLGKPYLPGSTLKGALRTALGTALAQQRQLKVTLRQLEVRRERAAQRLEQTLFSPSGPRGQEPNYDLMRSMQIADSTPVAADRLELDNVAVWPAGQRGIPIDIEAVRAGTTFTARCKLDDYLLGAAADKLGYGRNADTIRSWFTVCRDHGIARLREEALFFAERDPVITRFYETTLQEAEATPDVLFTQLGWGTGWNSKTLSRIIKPDRVLLEDIVERYRLARGYQQGAPFPKTRHLVMDRGQPVMPLGWVRVRLR